MSHAVLQGMGLLAERMARNEKKLDAIEERDARIEAKLDALIEALADQPEQLDTTCLTTLDGEDAGGERDQSQSLG